MRQAKRAIRASPDAFPEDDVLHEESQHLEMFIIYVEEYVATTERTSSKVAFAMSEAVSLIKIPLFESSQRSPKRANGMYCELQHNERDRLHTYGSNGIMNLVYWKFLSLSL
jgi:hypothetical protein